MADLPVDGLSLSWFAYPRRPTSNRFTAGGGGAWVQFPYKFPISIPFFQCHPAIQKRLALRFPFKHANSQVLVYDGGAPGATVAHFHKSWLRSGWEAAFWVGGGGGEGGAVITYVLHTLGE